VLNEKTANCIWEIVNLEMNDSNEWSNKRFSEDREWIYLSDDIWSHSSWSSHATISVLGMETHLTQENRRTFFFFYHSSSVRVEIPKCKLSIFTSFLNFVYFINYFPLDTNIYTNYYLYLKFFFLFFLFFWGDFVPKS